MSDSIGSVSFRPVFARNRIDTSFTPTRDGEVARVPISREPERIAYDPRLEPKPSGASSVT